MINPKKHSRGIAGLILTVAVCMQVTAVPATATAQVSIEEVVVTALQREQSLQDTPASVSVFTERQIETAGIENPADFIMLSAGVTMVNAAEYGDTQVSIRGINGTRDAETNYALVVDGVLLTNPNALNQELVDIEQIEILKGPQGAIYGRNAVAGAIVIQTRKPTEEFEAKVNVGAGNNGTVKLQGLVSGELAANVYGRFTLSGRDTDGHYTNTFLNLDNVDSLNDYSFSGRVIWKLSAGGELDWRLKYSEVESPSISFNGSPHFIDAAAAFGNPNFNGNVNEHNFAYISNIESLNEQENLNFSVKFDHQLVFADLTASFSYNDQSNFLLADGSSGAYQIYYSDPVCIQSHNRLKDANYSLPAPYFFSLAGDGPSGASPNTAAFLPAFSPTTCDGYQYQERNQEDYNFEIRFSSLEQDTVSWQFGFSYNNIEREVAVAQGRDQNMPITAQPFNAASSNSPTDQLFHDVFGNDVFAVFGQVVFDLNEELQLLLALRYDREERDVDNQVPLERSTLEATPFTPVDSDASNNRWINPAFEFNNAQLIPDRSRSFSQLQPKVSLTWQSSELLTLYGSYGIGFRSGGFNSQGTLATIQSFFGPANLLVGNLLNVRDEYEKEVSESLELGFKSNLLDGRLTINGAIYRTEVEDMQFFSFFSGPFGLLRTITNIDEATLQGAELEINLAVTDSLSVYGSASVLDSEIDSNRNRPFTVGNEVPYAPENTFNLGAVFAYPVSAGMELTVRADWAYVGDTWFHTVQDDLPDNWFTQFGFGRGDFSNARRDAYNILNLRLTLATEQWQVAVYGKNITDEEYLEESIPAPEFGGSFIWNGAADSYGVELTWNF